MSRERKYSDEFRVQVVRRMLESKNITALSRELGIARKLMYQWRDEARAKKMPVRDEEKERLKRQVAELQRLLGRQAAELDFFKGALRRVEAQRQKKDDPGGAASTSKSS